MQEIDFKKLNTNAYELFVEKVSRRFPMQYGVTLGRDGETQIRPLEFKFRQNGRFYFDTVDTYESYREMREHPFMRICIGDQQSMSYVTLSGNVAFTKDPEIVKKCFENSSVLTRQYGEHPEKVIAYYLTDMAASFSTFLSDLRNRKWKL